MALALSAGVLVCSSVTDRIRFETDPRQRLVDPAFDLRSLDCVDNQTLADDLANPPSRVQGRGRVLEDHLQSSSDPPQLAAGHRGEFLPAEAHRP